MDKIAKINCSMEEVIFNTFPVKNSQILGVSSVAMVTVNSPFTKNIFFDNKGMERIVNNIPISNASDLTANKDLSEIRVEQGIFKVPISRGAVLKDLSLRSCLFTETDFSYADLAGSKISDFIFVSAKMDKANLTVAKLINIDFARTSTIVMNQGKAQL